MKYFKKPVFSSSRIRFLVVFSINFILWPLIRPIVRWKKLFNFVFLTYPATRKEITYYCPSWFRPYAPKISIIGVFWSKNRKNRGVVITTPYTLREFAQLGNQKEFLKEVLNNARIFSQSIKASAIALAGRLPAIFSTNGESLKPPIVKGDKGTVFAVIETVRAVLEKESLLPQDIQVGVLGVGFIGQKILSELKNMGFQSIIGIDPRFRHSLKRNGSNIRFSPDISLLVDCKIVLVLTTRGVDIKQNIPYLQSGAIVIDDTYPSIPTFLVKKIIHEKEVKVFKVLSGLSESRFIPALPGYDPAVLPGCALEAIVVSQNNIPDSPTQTEFGIRARKIGFKPIIVPLKG